MSGGTTLYSHHGTLGAGTVDTVVLSEGGGAVSVTNLDDTDTIWARFEPPMGTADPAAGAANTLPIVKASTRGFAIGPRVTTVKLVSGGAAEYVVDRTQ